MLKFARVPDYSQPFDRDERAWRLQPPLEASPRLERPASSGVSPGTESTPRLKLPVAVVASASS